MKTPLLLFLLCAWALTAPGQNDLPFTRLFDTGAPSSEPLTGENLAKAAGWKQVPEDSTNHNFSGDALLLNDKVALVFRKQGLGPELYSRTTDAFTQRATLGYAANHSSPLSLPASVTIVENSSGAVKVEARFKGSGNAALRFRLTAGEAIVEIQSNEEGGYLNVQSASQYVVVPDYFGDDMVYKAADARERSLPAENICLNLIDGNNAMLMAVWQSNEQEVFLAPFRTDTQGTTASMRIGCLKNKPIWLAFLESNGIWRSLTGPSDNSWKSPFPAKWRSTFGRENGVADSWDTTLGPGSGQTEGNHEGPMLVYPIDRTPATPLTATCPTDVMRNTLGVGPCQYILACEGLGAQGDPTPNSVMNWVEKLFDQKKDKHAADDIKERLELMSRHLADARSKIQRYADFSAQVRLALADRAAPYQVILDDLARFAATGLTPASAPARARELAAKVVALIGRENSLNDCQQLGQQLRAIGAAQDAALAKCRMGVRRLRAQSRDIAGQQSAKSIPAQQVQRLAEQILRNK
jgi:hypothetical protein